MTKTMMTMTKTMMMKTGFTAMTKTMTTMTLANLDTMGSTVLLWAALAWHTEEESRIAACNSPSS